MTEVDKKMSLIDFYAKSGDTKRIYSMYGNDCGHIIYVFQCYNEYSIFTNNTINTIFNHCSYIKNHLGKNLNNLSVGSSGTFRLYEPTKEQLQQVENMLNMIDFKEEELEPIHLVFSSNKSKKTKINVSEPVKRAKEIKKVLNKIKEDRAAIVETVQQLEDNDDNDINEDDKIKDLEKSFEPPYYDHPIGPELETPVTEIDSPIDNEPIENKVRDSATMQLQSMIKHIESRPSGAKRSIKDLVTQNKDYPLYENGTTVPTIKRGRPRKQ
jgi:hypothetical protein